MKSSGIGGQAVIEGVMMKNHSKYAVVVRKENGELEVQKGKFVSVKERNRFFQMPIIRGVVSFVESMFLGMKTLTFSAGVFEEEEEGKSKEKEENTKESVIMGLTVFVSILAAIAIFIVLPYLLSELFRKSIDNTTLLAIIEGVIRILLFTLYVVLISQMEDIKRVFMYHGAEHKSINCVESGLPLTVTNVKKQSKHHKRCGTSFMLIVMFISIIFFIFIHVNNIWLRIVYRLLLIPVVAGVSFEFIKLAGNSDAKIVEILSKPGMLLQRLTTREPDDKMIEVAIRSIEEVFDWQAYQQKETESRERKERLQKAGVSVRNSKNRKNDKKKNAERREAIAKREKEHAERMKRQKEEEEQAKALEEAFLENVKAAQKRKESRKRMAEIEKQNEDARKQNAVEEKDEILDNLDRFFDEDTAEKKEKTVAENSSAEAKGENASKDNNASADKSSKKKASNKRNKKG